MNPRLLVISGPLAGKVLPLEASVSVGRGADCTLRIKQPSVSRLHCLVEREGDSFRLTDHSSYGTLVNGAPVKEQFLEHGDRIDVGSHALRFLVHEAAASADSHGVRLDDGDLVTRSELRLRDEPSFFDAARLTAGPSSPERALRDLQVLLRIGATLNSFSSLASLRQQLLESLFEVVPAERGAVILLREGSEDFADAFSLERSLRHGPPLVVSRTVTRQVAREGVPLLSNDVAGGEAYEAAESLLASRTSSLLCVPLKDGARVAGLIYLASGDLDTPFDERHLELVTAVACFCAPVVERVRQLEWLEGERRRLREELLQRHTMIGDSPRMREVFEVIAKAAPTDSSVLIRGESGTGKELVAQAIHAGSPRSEKPFIAINCAALTESLIESELFGHEKGAFTGAVTQKKGKIEVADGGTLFLDEVAELPPSLQAKLLRVLQERTFERVGSTRPIKVDIRLIAATNKNLQDAIAAGAFRADLYYRLDVISIEMPALRERREDIPLLAHHFAERHADKCKRRVAGLSAEACARLTSYDWPGNVRELANAVERAVVLGAGDLIMPEDLPENIRGNGAHVHADGLSFYDMLRDIKKQLILNAFKRAGGNHAAAAKLLGVHPNNLYRLLRTLNLKLE